MQTFNDSSFNDSSFNDSPRFRSRRDAEKHLKEALGSGCPDGLPAKLYDIMTDSGVINRAPNDDIVMSILGDDELVSLAAQALKLMTPQEGFFEISDTSTFMEVTEKFLTSPEIMWAIWALAKENDARAWRIWATPSWQELLRIWSIVTKNGLLPTSDFEWPLLMWGVLRECNHS